jgi:hypothetical protein
MYKNTCIVASSNTLSARRADKVIADKVTLQILDKVILDTTIYLSLYIRSPYLRGAEMVIADKVVLDTIPRKSASGASSITLSARRLKRSFE